jgi:uncharacterized protein YjbI with pentapeptide repeats
MPDKTQLEVLRKGVKVWNDWPVAHLDVRPVLEGVHLLGLDLMAINLSGADLRKADLRGTNLTDSSLVNVQLDGANFFDLSWTAPT